VCSKLTACVGRAWADTNAGLDASNEDGHINMQKWNIYGMLMADTVKAYTASDGVEYLVTANEGDDKVRQRDLVRRAVLA
jgi:hypothetical protein